MYEEIGIHEKTIQLMKEAEQEIQLQWREIDQLQEQNSLKVLASFHKHHISEAHFNETTGYGYNDLGRDTIEKVFADVLGSEDAIVRGQFISGTHA